jgi:hypothetical protein
MKLIEVRSFESGEVAKCYQLTWIGFAAFAFLGAVISCPEVSASVVSILDHALQICITF